MKKFLKGSLVTILFLFVTFYLSAQTINVTSPNGGEEWKSDSTYDITWTSSGTTGRVALRYSVNNGMDWTGIVSDTPDDGVYEWTVPYTPSDSCIIWVSDTNWFISDISDSVFRIFSDPFIIIKSPNGGEDWEVTTNHDITWTSNGTSGAVNIMYSVNNGLNWTEIISDTPDDGIYQWTIPDTLSDSCLVMVSDTNGSLSDTSDAVFKTSPLSFITVTSPNGGEEWKADSTYDITWVSNGTSGDVSLRYSVNNGLNWNTIVVGTPDDSVYQWTVPYTPSDSCIVRVSDSNELIWDISDSVFRIFSDPFIIITSPNGGEDWGVTTDHDITWTSSGTSGAVNIMYSVNNGLNWTEIISDTPDDGIYQWTIPDTLSDSCLVMVSDTNGSLSDTSDAVFKTSPLSFITVTSPNGGEEWEVDSTYDITWISNGTSGDVSIMYSIDNGQNWIGIIINTPDDGIHPWTVPDTPSENCLMVVADTNGIISDTSEISIGDVSNSVFTIVNTSGISDDIPNKYSFDLKSIVFNNLLEVKYGLPEQAKDVRFTIYDIAGKKIKEENLTGKPAGFYSLDMKMDDVAKGVYFIRIQVDEKEYTKTNKFVLM